MIVKTMAEMKELDRRAIDGMGIPSLELMENAANEIVNVALQMLGEKKTVCVVCGTGNNGGDGYAAARLLYEKDKDVVIFMVGNKERLTNDSKANVQRLNARNVPVIPFEDTEDVKKKIGKTDLVIDALFGVGVTRALEGIYKTAVEYMNAAGCPILSCDLPSGLNGDTGEILGVSVKATETVTFTFPKKGMYLLDGPRVTGKVHVVQIGIPEELLS